MTEPLSDDRVNLLRALAVQYPSPEAAISEAAALRAKLTLPRGLVHVISDVHGEDMKLRHVINNASGALRQLVDQYVGDRLSPEDKQQFLAVLYYPREAINKFSHRIVASGNRLEWVYRTLCLQFEIVRHLRAWHRRDAFERLLPGWYRELFVELGSGQRPEYIKEMIAGLAIHDRDWGAVRAGARLIRNLSCEELLVIGDLGDRGPRMDRVIETLMRQPKCNILWGNHDMLWFGSQIGHEPCMLTCLRFSLRYRKLSQLEEGYGVMMAPIERLVRQVYADDPAERFIPKGEGFRDTLTVARMQKAVAIMQFKAEGRMLERHPQWLVTRGRMWTKRDEVLLFHACVPVETDGTPQILRVDGRDLAGRELMDALGSVVRRAMRKRWFNLDDDADWLWYLWGGPRSPLFGKDRLATFETYFIADKATHKEHKNAYFDLMHDAAFIRRVGTLFGCGDDVLVVNGHVPVKIEKGEQPVKAGGNAITIDGAFSEAYGDRGYTLVLEPDRIDLAEHAPFQGVEAAISDGADIVPKITPVRQYPGLRLVRDTDEGRRIARRIGDLDTLVRAYQEGLVQPK